MWIGNIEIGSHVFIVAEAGSNHNGNFALARQLVVEAAKAGADAVKFQVYCGEKLVTADLPVMSHVRGRDKTQRERFKSLEFTHAQWAELADLAKSCAINFFASVFDEDSADAVDPLVPAFKIASGDLANMPLLEHVVKKGKPIILSTGMADIEEIENTIALLPKDRLAVLHCVSLYPTPAEDANLRAIPFLAERLSLPIGYSDHTLGIWSCVAAVALGACIIEKHFTLDRNQPIGDHKLSAEPKEMADMVAAIRQIERALGRHEKVPGPRERDMRAPLRRSLYARHEIPAGKVIAREDLVALRPGTGMPPRAMGAVVGRRAMRTIPAESAIRDEDLEPAGR